MSDADERKGAGKHDGKRDGHSSGRPPQGGSRDRDGQRGSSSHKPAGHGGDGQRRYSEHRDGAPRREGDRYGSRDGAPRRDGDRYGGSSSSAHRNDSRGGHGGGYNRAESGHSGSRDGERRPSSGGDKPRYGGDKPRYSGDKPRYSSDKPRYSSDKPGYGGDKPRYSGGDKPRYGADKPRYSGDKPGYGGDKPRHSGGDKPRYSGGDKPRYSGGDKPRYSGGDKPRYGADKPRYSGDKPGYGGDNRRDDRKPYGDRDRSAGAQHGSKPYRGGKPGERSDDRRHGDGYRGDGYKGDSKYGASRGGRPGGPRRDDRDGERRSSRPPQDERALRAPEPELPEDITARDLHPSARNELKTLSKENADAVARHLAMAGILIDEDPQRAHEHALAASRRAGRVGVVRETVAITAYATGDYALALRELRTHRRISGSDEQIALIVDSERGVGRPERALEEGRGVDRATLPIAVRVQLAIAMSGARLDLGQPDRALTELDIPELDPDRAFEWSPALFLARATVLEELGRTDEAAQWNRRATVAAEALDAAAGVGEDETIEVEEIIDEVDERDEVDVLDEDDALDEGEELDDDEEHEEVVDAEGTGDTAAEAAPADEPDVEEIIVVDDLIEDERD